MDEFNREERILTVSELSSLISSCMKETFSDLSVEGEVTNFRQMGSGGHWYFSLKDNTGALINCTCFRNRNWNQRKPENGELVVLTGSLSFWDKGGSLSFNASTIRLKGSGDLKAMLEQRRRKYEELGYFDPRRKKELPEHVDTIGVVTSDTGAVIRDIIRNSRRCPSINILIFPSPVQGEGADKVIARRIRQANIFSACDVLIVGRGGGSEEDLLPYSSELVIEAIYESRIPVISAVGHDSDWPLSDLVADKRCSTPTAAAILATEKDFNRLEAYRNIKREMKLYVMAKLQKAYSSLSSLSLRSEILNRRMEMARKVLEEEKLLRKDLEHKCENAYLGIDYNLEAQRQAMSGKLERTRQDVIRKLEEARLIAISRMEDQKRLCLDYKREVSALVKDRFKDQSMKVCMLCRSMEDLNPLSILDRGYALIRDDEGNIIRSIRNLKDNCRITIHLADGEKQAIVTGGDIR